MTIKILLLLAVMLPANCCPWGACYVRKAPADAGCFMADDEMVCKSYGGTFYAYQWCK